MVFKKDLTPLSRRGIVKNHRGKGAMEQMLPSRHALNTLTSGDPADRSQQMYAKATPGPETATPSIMDFDTDNDGE